MHIACYNQHIVKNTKLCSAGRDNDSMHLLSGMVQYWIYSRYLNLGASCNVFCASSVFLLLKLCLLQKSKVQKSKKLYIMESRCIHVCTLETSWLTKERWMRHLGFVFCCFSNYAKTCLHISTHFGAKPNKCRHNQCTEEEWNIHIATANNRYILRSGIVLGKYAPLSYLLWLQLLA